MIAVNWDNWLPLLVVGVSLVTGVAIFMLPEERFRARTVLNMAGATLKLVFIIIIVAGVLREDRHYESRLPFIPGLDLVLIVDPISLVFVALSAGLWFVTTIYAIGYLEHAPNRRRFFGFFSICVTATMGIALAGNPITFFVFYEMLTLATYPLVIHRGTSVAIAAGRTYLLYTLVGGAVLLAGVVWMQAVAGPVEFRTGGVLGDVADTHPEQLTVIFALLIGGLAVKAALAPLHGWLPRAMVAPAPVSALLHAVAVVKAGAYGILRVVYDMYGTVLAESLNVLTPLGVVAAFTIVYGSLRALTQDELKRRLAFSTVSQVSYIVLGASIIGPLATMGALAHLMHQGLMKITLFFCAGNIAETLGIHHIHELNGVGRRMPLTMAAFTIGAFGMIGAPPVAGFVTKWYLGTGALAADQTWIVAVLAVSTLLNAAYFLPILHAAWFKQPDHPWDEHVPGTRLETKWTLLVPSLVTAIASLGAGLLAGVPFSPLELSRAIAVRMYGP